MTTTWKTKYGPRRVKHDPPTLEEAIFAARGLTDDVDASAEIPKRRTRRNTDGVAEQSDKQRR